MSIQTTAKKSFVFQGKATVYIDGKNRNFKSRSGTLLSKGTQAWNEE